MLLYTALKRVTPDMQTHKNTALRSGPAPFKAPTTGTRSVGAPVVTDKPPSFVKDGKKWMVVRNMNIYMIEQ